MSRLLVPARLAPLSSFCVSITGNAGGQETGSRRRVCRGASMRVATLSGCRSLRTVRFLALRIRRSPWRDTTDRCRG
ncbi:MAG TPA: hypothetical protein VLI90_03885 [Tepidisphaeraceae bacterium]|nr:hypothetical protein [Tepidisphaeraceae bacterium]